MTFVRAKPGGWALFEILTSAQMNIIDTQLEFALDGASGGVYSPSGSLTWRNKWIVDTSPGGIPSGPAFDIVTDPGRTGLRSVGGADGGFGVSAFGGLRTSGMRTQGGNSATAGGAGRGIEAYGGNNSGTGQAGPGILCIGGAASFGQSASGGVFTGGVAGAAGLGGGRGVEGTGGAGLTTGSGGDGALLIGGAAPGIGNGGTGLFANGGTSVSGRGGIGVDARGGTGATGGGTALFAVGGGSLPPTVIPGSGAQVKAGTTAGAIGLAVESVSGSAAAMIVSSHSAGGPAIWALAAGANIGVIGQNQNGTGHGVAAIARPNTPGQSSLYVGPQDADPSAGANGGVMFGSALHPSGEARMRVFQDSPLPVWQAVVTNLTRESVKAFASASSVAGVVTLAKAYNLTASIVGAGAASRIRFTFALPFASAADYQPQVTGINSVPTDTLPFVTDCQPGYFEVGLYDISAGAFQTINGGAGLTVICRVTVSGGYN